MEWLSGDSEAVSKGSSDGDLDEVAGWLQGDDDGAQCVGDADAGAQLCRALGDDVSSQMALQDVAYMR